MQFEIEIETGRERKRKREGGGVKCDNKDKVDGECTTKMLPEHILSQCKWDAQPERDLSSARRVLQVLIETGSGGRHHRKTDRQSDWQTGKLTGRPTTFVAFQFQREIRALFMLGIISTGLAALTANDFPQIDQKMPAIFRMQINKWNCTKVN